MDLFKFTETKIMLDIRVAKVDNTEFQKEKVQKCNTTVIYKDSIGS